MSKCGLGEGAFVYVADSAMVTEDNLNAIGPNRFISRLPATYGECGRVIAEAVDQTDWVDIGKLAEARSTPDRPCAEYRIKESSVTLYGTPYRAIVVHSSSHDKRRRKKLDKMLVGSAKAIAAEAENLETTYFCEADAQAAAKRAETLSGGLHDVVPTIHPIEKRRRGRPPKGRPAPTCTQYRLSCRIVENEEAVKRARSAAGCFVLLTNVPAHGHHAMDAQSLLETYKGQYGVESNFAFLKDPIVVNDLFLKSPARIDALGMILVIALMIWRLMERSMRTYLENTQTSLIGWRRRQTTKPTSFMMTTAMTGIAVAMIARQRYLLCKPAPRQMDFLAALGLDATVFTDCHCRCQPVIPAGNGPGG
jgi:transposase